MDLADVPPARAAHWQLILSALGRHPEGLPRCEIERVTGLRANQVTGRVGELLARRMVYVAGSRRCELHAADVEVLQSARAVLGNQLKIDVFVEGRR